MSDTPVFQVVNPLARTIEEGEEIIAQLQAVSALLEEAIQFEREMHSRYRDALEGYEMAETEELAEVVVMAQQKEGPLAGIAVSGKGYDICLNNLKNNLRGGALAHAWNAVQRHRHSYETAQVELQQTEARFNALRKIADIKTQVLRASTI